MAGGLNKQDVREPRAIAVCSEVVLSSLQVLKIELLNTKVGLATQLQAALVVIRDPQNQRQQSYRSISSQTFGAIE